VYDNSGGAQACRAWWTLRWAGLANVRVLDVGYGAWIETNRPSSNHVSTRAALAGDVVLTSGGMPTISAEEAAALAAQSRLLDARPRAAYAGDPAKPGTGHIPEPFTRLRATTSPTENSSRTTNYTPDFRPSEQTDRRKSEFIAAAAMRLRMQSRRCARLGLRPRFMSVRGRHGAPIHLAL
jgi:3-mercaptopyruvate sulfurtransferase SseA